MKNKIIKIHYDNKVYLSFLFIFLFGIGIIVAKYSNKEDCFDVDFDMISTSFSVGEYIEFKSFGDKGYKWEWSFGDGTDKDYLSSTLHKFDAVGLYNIILKVNNTCIVKRELNITKKEDVKKMNHNVPEIKFSGARIRVGDIVSFECTSEFAKKWEWRFGDYDEVDDVSAKTTHVFDKEDIYKISLVVNGDNENALIKTIKVFPKRKKRRPGTPIDPVEGVFGSIIPNGPIADPDPSEEEKPPVTVKLPVKKKIVFSRRDAKKMLEDYALGKIDKRDIRNNFCSNNIRVVNTLGKVSSLNDLLKAIRARKIRVNDVTLYKDNESGCVKVMNVDLKIKGLIWKKY